MPQWSWGLNQIEGQDQRKGYIPTPPYVWYATIDWGIWERTEPGVTWRISEILLENSLHYLHCKSAGHVGHLDEFVCPPNISKTVAVRIMKLAHRPRIASTTIKLISKPVLLSIFISFSKTSSANQNLALGQPLEIPIRVGPTPNIAQINTQWFVGAAI